MSESSPGAEAESGGPGESPTPTADAAPSGPAGKDPLRGSRTSGTWVAVVALVVVLVLLAIFILQNTQSVEVSYFGWSGHAPLAAALLIAVAAGLVIAVIAGSMRILQLRRRVRREQKR
jgi:uncharacterized integral membrane protein